MAAISNWSNQIFGKIQKRLVHICIPTPEGGGGVRLEYYGVKRNLMSLCNRDTHTLQFYLFLNAGM